jgi:plasmid stabilization system protein ParE
VFDDCPDGSARSVVEAFGDKRFSYVHNTRRLGAIGNIDQAFRNRPFAGGAWALVLDDDAYLLPRHLDAQLENCRVANTPVTFSAMLVEEVVEPGEPGRLLDLKTIAWIYPEGRYGYRDLLPAVLFSHAFANGSAFWRIGCASNFEVGTAVTQRPGIQETLRMFKLKDDVYVSHRATAVWRLCDAYTAAPPDRLSDRLKMRWQRLAERREIEDYRDWFLRRYGQADAVAFVRDIEPANLSLMERSLLFSGRYVVMSDQSMRWRISRLVQGLIFRSLLRRRLDMSLVETSPSETRSV